MTRQFQVYLDIDDSAVTYSCVHCRAHLADYRDLLSKSFQGSQGRAYLFDKIVNVKSAAAEDRLLLTGHHRVADIHCICCDTLLGWKYEKAFEPSQRYKEGKYIIELIHIIKENRWDVSLTPRAKRRSSGCSSERVDQSGAASPLSQGGQQNGGFAGSSTDLIDVMFPSNCVQGAAVAATAAAPCSSWPNPTLLSSSSTQLEESGLFHSDESPSAAVLLEQGQQGEHSEPGFIPHADLVPQLIQQSGSPPQDDGSDISHPRSSLEDLNICTTTGAAASPPSEHLTLFSPQRSPSKKSKKPKKHFRGAVASVGSHPRLASSSSTCTLTEPLLDAEPEMATSFLYSVVDDSADLSQPSSGRPSGSHQLILPPSESVLTLLTEVASPSDALSDSKKEPHEEAFSALDW